MLISDFDRVSFGGTSFALEAFLAGAVFVLDIVGFEGVGLAGGFEDPALEGAGVGFETGAGLDEGVGFARDGFDDFSAFGDFSSLSTFAGFSALGDLSVLEGEGAGEDTGEDPGNAPIRVATRLVGGVGLGGSAFAGAFDETLAGSGLEEEDFGGDAFSGAVFEVVGFTGSTFLGGPLTGMVLSGAVGAGGVAGVDAPPPRKAAARSRTLIVGT